MGEDSGRVLESVVEEFHIVNLERKIMKIGTIPFKLKLENLAEVESSLDRLIEKAEKLKETLVEVEEIERKLS